jgi:hypothetical protein
MAQSILDKTLFLNVDLDIVSKSDLQPLVDAMGKDVFVLYVGRVRRHYEAHLEWNGSHMPPNSYQSSPESLILKFCKLVQRLNPDVRALWDSAKTRSFDAGISAPKRGNYYWTAIGSEAIRTAAEVGAQVGITVYGPMKTIGKAKAQRAIASPKKAKSKRA